MSNKKPRILISNDDSIYSEGIRQLAKALKSFAKVYVIAPDRERSAVSHSLTLSHPLRVETIAPNYYSVNGTPTDCINLAVNGILKERPDLVVSGINKGGNLGDDITYSGTVSAAMEGTLLGIPSFAISVVGKNRFRFEPAAEFAVRLAKIILKKGLPKDTLLNVNIPNIDKEKIKFYRITKQGRRIYGDVIVEKVDPRGKKYYWIGGDDLGFEESEESDFNAIKNNYISIYTHSP